MLGLIGRNKKETLVRCVLKDRIKHKLLLVFLFKGVNHSIWLVVGSLHTNSIESLWNHLKKIIDNFLECQKTI